MRTATIPTDESVEERANGQRRRTHGWRLWLAPRPFTLVSTVMYVLVLFTVIDELGQRAWPWRIASIAGVLLLLAVIDRLDYWRWGETPPVNVAVLLIFIRLALIEVVALVGDAWYGMLLHCLVVYLASFYFGARGSAIIGVVVWLVFVGRSTLLLPLLQPNTAVGTNISDIIWFTLILIFVGTIAKVRVDERASRAQAERLLTELQQAHEQLKVSARYALALVQERHRLAQEIHERLGHGLAAIGVQLEKALAFRSIDPVVAEQAVGDAKRLGSETLQDVRRSVGALRTAEHIAAPVGPSFSSAAPVQPPRRRGVMAWLLPRTFDLAPTVVYLAIVTEYLSWDVQDGQVWRWVTFAFLGMLLSLLVTDRIDYWLWGEAPPAKAAAALLSIRFALFAGISVVIGSWYLLWLMPLVPYYGYLYYGGRGGTRLSIIIWSLLALMAVLGFHSEGAAADVGNFVLGMFFISFMLLLVVITSKSVLKDRDHRLQAEKLLADLQHAHAQLKAYAEQALAVTQERNHLAREIHDGLGHYLTVINVQLEKALAFREIDAVVADQAVYNARRLTGEALQEVRGSKQTLGVAGDSFSLQAALRQLVQNIGGGQTIDLHIAGREDDFSQQSLLTLYRITQEGLTNIQKHAQATHVLVDLTFGEHEARLVLRDDGRGFDLACMQPQMSQARCYGLQGARERVELLGGLLQVRSSPGAGAELRIVVPKDPLTRSSQTPVQASEEVL